MRRSGEEYERLDGLAREILVDYQVSSFPLDLLWLSKRMGFDVVPYSAYEGSANFPLLLKRSKDGFSYPAGIGKVPTIFYNDKYGDNLTPARIQSTIGHEIKHLIDGDEDDSDADEIHCESETKLSDNFEEISCFKRFSEVDIFDISVESNFICIYDNSNYGNWL